MSNTSCRDRVVKLLANSYLLIEKLHNRKFSELYKEEVTIERFSSDFVLKTSSAPYPRCSAALIFSLLVLDASIPYTCICLRFRCLSIILFFEHMNRKEMSENYLSVFLFSHWLLFWNQYFCLSNYDFLFFSFFQTFEHNSVLALSVYKLSNHSLPV